MLIFKSSEIPTLSKSGGVLFQKFKKDIFEKISNDLVKALKDLTLREKSILFPFVILIVLFGIYPLPVLDLISVSSLNLLDNLNFSGGLE